MQLGLLISAKRFPRNNKRKDFLYVVDNFGFVFVICCRFLFLFIFSLYLFYNLVYFVSVCFHIHKYI